MAENLINHWMLDLTSKQAIQAAMPNSDFLVTLQDAKTQQFSRVKEKLVTMYHKYRSYYDDKAEAKPLELFSYCLLLNPR